MFRLENPIREYAWGSRTALAEFLGRPTPSEKPQGEVWIGAHPLAPSKLFDAGNRMFALDTAIRGAPETMLGPAVIARFGQTLPFLLKVMAADRPMPLQVHPNAAQAQRGFDRETAAKIPLDAPQRLFHDRQRTPELIVALAPFQALIGFRPVAETLRLLDVLPIPELANEIAELETEPNRHGLRRTVERLLRTPAIRRKTLVRATAMGCKLHLDAGRAEFAHECCWAIDLADRFPGDIAVVIALLMNFVRVPPATALFVPEGTLHAYLHGTALALTTASSNVIRGGLTEEPPIAPGELVKITDFTPTLPATMHPHRMTGRAENEMVYDTPTPEFRLSRLDITASAHPDPQREIDGPEIWLCTAGTLTVTAAHRPLVTLRSGEAIFVPASTGQIDLHGTGTVFRAATGLSIPVASASTSAEW